MASYSYAGLEVRVTADTRGMALDIRQAATSAGQDAARGISESMSKGLSALGGLLGAVGKSVATGLGVASAAAIGFGVSAFQSAARVGEMDASLRALAKSNNLSNDQVQASVQQVRKAGIEYGVSQQVVAQFARNQLNLADATKLARVAQDAAVISGRNSTEVLSDLIHGVTTQNSLVLRNAGLNVQAGKAIEDYAKAQGKAAKDLTESERAQAVLNATLKSGERIAGAYTEAMKEPGKVLRSFPRLIDDIKVSVGQGLVKALGPAILGLYDMAKALSEAVAPGGVLAPLFDAIGVAVGKLVAPVTRIIAQWTAWISALKPEQISRAVAAVERFGPVLLIAAGALAALTGAGVITKIPIIGGLLSNLLGPAKALAHLFGVLGGAAFNSAAGMAGASAGATGLAKAVAIATGPVGLIIAAIVAVVAASGKLRSALLETGKALISALMPALRAVVDGVKQVLPPILDVARAVGDNLAPVFEQLAPLLAPLGQLLGTVIAQAFANLGGILRAVAPAVIALVTVIGFLLKIALQVVVPVARFAIGLLQAAAAAGAFTAPARALAAVLSVVANAIALVVRWIFGGSPGLIPAFLALAKVVGPAIAAVMAAVNVLRAVVGVIASVISAVTSVWLGGWRSIASATAGAVNSVRSVVSSGFNAVRSVVSSAMSATTSVVSSGFSSIRGAASSGSSAVLAAVSSSFNQLRGVVSSAMAAIPGLVSSGLSAAVGAARSGGAAIVSGLQAGMQSAVGAVMSTISGIASKVSGALSSALKIGSPSRLTIPMGYAVAEGIAVGFGRGWGEVEHAISGVHVPGVTGGGLAGFGDLGGLGSAAGPTINVYPSAGMDERQLAALVSRELAWATAGGA